MFQFAKKRTSSLRCNASGVSWTTGNPKVVSCYLFSLNSSLEYGPTNTHRCHRRWNLHSMLHSRCLLLPFCGAGEVGSFLLGSLFVPHDRSCTHVARNWRSPPVSVPSLQFYGVHCKPYGKPVLIAHTLHCLLGGVLPTPENDKNFRKNVSGIKSARDCNWLIGSRRGSRILVRGGSRVFTPEPKICSKKRFFS